MARNIVLMEKLHRNTLKKTERMKHMMERSSKILQRRYTRTCVIIFIVVIKLINIATVIVVVVVVASIHGQHLDILMLAVIHPPMTSLNCSHIWEGKYTIDEWYLNTIRPMENCGEIFSYNSTRNVSKIFVN